MNPRNAILLLAKTTVMLAIAGMSAATLAADTNKKSEPPATLLARIKAVEAQQEKNLVNFDDLDFNVYSNQKWDELTKSHTHDIIVHNADGKVVKGLAAHIDDLKQMFVFAPDTKVVSHPIRIAQGNYTAVQGVVKGTFSQPMPIGDGKTIAPTHKSFTLSMVTIGRWENGVMTEEWLYWDNLDFMKQIGVMP
ncbi:ester cyclase [Massilia sp. DJPM01]|uniref:ester cyclase n=1 Tax=Massilia sp. DJPM01 TaxID=3024404 RepID=UPI00259DCF1F|nr:ester cyclase [Massilia sp. DJPM01]MDM5179945.1 ester cyclase [Massilia sp. DJPM01]